MEEATFRDIKNTIFSNKWILIISIIAALGIGLLIYALQPDEYQSEVAVTPTLMEESDNGGALGNLAELAGVSGVNQKGGLSVSIYDAIVSSTPFLYDVIRKKVLYHGDSVRLRDYLTQIEVVRFSEKLHALFYGKPDTIKPVVPEKTVSHSDSSRSMFLENLSVSNLSGISKKAISILNKKVTYTVEPGQPISVAVSLQDPLVSAQTTVLIVKCLSAYVKDFRMNKEKNKLAFLEQEADASQKKLYAAQITLATAKDQNQDLVTSIARTKINRLSMQYKLALQDYNYLMGMVNHLKLSINKQKSVFVVIQPPMVLPVSAPTAPRLTIYVILSLVLGVLAGLAIIFTKYFLKRNW